MTLRHGVSAAILFLAGIGWAVNPPTRLAGRRVQVGVSCIAAGFGALAAGAWVHRKTDHP